MEAELDSIEAEQGFGHVPVGHSAANTLHAADMWHAELLKTRLISMLEPRRFMQCMTCVRRSVAPPLCDCYSSGGAKAESSWFLCNTTLAGFVKWLFESSRGVIIANIRELLPPVSKLFTKVVK